MNARSNNRNYKFVVGNDTFHVEFIDDAIDSIHKLIKEGKRCFCLYGQLGAGKTFLTQRLLKSFGYSNNVTSPTFVILNEYQVNNKLFQGKVYHFDVYRTNEEELVQIVDLDDILEDKSNIIIIEWADKICEILPKDRVDIFIEY